MMLSPHKLVVLVLLLLEVVSSLSRGSWWGHYRASVVLRGVKWAGSHCSSENIFVHGRHTQTHLLGDLQLAKLMTRSLNGSCRSRYTRDESWASIIVHESSTAVRYLMIVSIDDTYAIVVLLWWINGNHFSVIHQALLFGWSVGVDLSKTHPRRHGWVMTSLRYRLEKVLREVPAQD
jgi:hypothetical protein